MKKIIKAGATDQTIDVFIQDSTSTTGAGKTGLAYNTAGLKCYYRKGATGSATALTLATQTVGGAHSDGGFVEIDATNMPGMYRLDLSDTIVAAAGSVTLMLSGATGMAPLPIELQVIAADLEDGAGLGLSRMDAAVSTRLAAASYTAPLDAAGTRSAVGLASANLDTQIALLATAANLATVAGYLDTEILAMKAVLDALSPRLPGSGTLSTLDAAGVRAAVGLASANLDTQLGDLPTAAENATAVLTTQMTEAYRANGAAPTLAQAQFEVIAHLGESSIAGTTKTINKIDHSTAAATFTLDSDTTPTSITRAT